MTPRQRGGGDTGPTDWGHRLNRVHSSRRGGDAHAKRGGGKKGGCFGVLILVGAMGAVVADLVVNYI